MRKKHMTKDRYHGNFTELWDHASAGDLIAIIPCFDVGDVLKSGKRVLDARLSGWFGSGKSENGFEEFLVVMCEKDAMARLRAFTGRVQAELHLSVIVAEGFDVTLFLAIFFCREGETEAVLQQPFGLCPRIEESPSGAMLLSFEPPAPQAQPGPIQWLDQLQKAYAEVQRYTSFTFEGRW